jgi:hypothetical protein
MALAWKAGWVNALRGSNPLSSAINKFQTLVSFMVVSFGHCPWLASATPHHVVKLHQR